MHNTCGKVTAKKAKTSKPSSVNRSKNTDNVKRSERKIHNDIIDNIRTGSALKIDPEHAFNNIIDNYADYAIKFDLEGGDSVTRTLYQIEGYLNGKDGIFEWILDPDPLKGVVHRRFIRGVKITGKPNARAK